MIPTLECTRNGLQTADGPLDPLQTSSLGTRSSCIAPLAGQAALTALGVYGSGKDIVISFPVNEDVQPVASRVGEEDVAGVPPAGAALAAGEAAFGGTRLHLVSWLPKIGAF